MSRAAFAVLTLLAAGVSAAGPAMVDFGKTTGPVRRLNGIGGGTSMKGSREAWESRLDDYAKLDFAMVRLHDIPLVNPGTQLVDLQCLFPVWNRKADPMDESNWFFDATDDYLKALRRSVPNGTVVYRLGSSIEHNQPRKYFARPFTDNAFYAEICAGVVRHYTTGWANGFDAGIGYWEIGNEPDEPKQWDGALETYLPLYVTVAKRLRAEFPGIKIGGPALGGLADEEESCDRLARLCRKEGAPLDFFSYHGYIRDSLSGRGGAAANLRKILDRNGFEAAELFFDEWHYVESGAWWPALKAGGDLARKIKSDPVEGLHGSKSAAFVVKCLVDWQDAPLSMACYYQGIGDSWGLYDSFWNRRPTWWAHYEFAQVSKGGRSVRAKAVGAPADVTLMACVREDGSKALLLSSMKPQPEMAIELKGVAASGEAVLFSLEGSDRTESRLAWNGGRMLLPAADRPFVRRVELQSGACR